MDITAQAGLATASGCVASGDFNGDGKLDLALCQGKMITLAIQNEASAFHGQPTGVEVPDCLSLGTIQGNTPRLLAGTSRGPVLISHDGQKSWRTAPLPTEPTQLQQLGAGGLCVIADFSAQGMPDIIQLHSRGFLRYAAGKDAVYQKPALFVTKLPEAPAAAVPGDFDADGRLDLVVGGHGGASLIAGGEAQSLMNITLESGELEYHVNAHQPAILAAGLFDVNNDSRQGLAFFTQAGPPMAFFNRGFACFGYARELHFDENQTNAAVSLITGQIAGLVTDLNADGVQDLLAVDKQNTIWMLPGIAKDRPPLGIELILSPKSDAPLTISVKAEDRVRGMYVLQSGVPVWVGRPESGPVTLQWIDRAGKAKSREVIVEGQTKFFLE